MKISIKIFPDIPGYLHPQATSFEDVLETFKYPCNLVAGFLRILKSQEFVFTQVFASKKNGGSKQVQGNENTVLLINDR